MERKIQLILIAIMFFWGVTNLFAQTESAEHKHMQSEAASATTEEAVNIGNKICPVSGDKINEETKATYEYEGKIYNFCCPMCIEEFKKDPEKYIKKIEQELQAESKEEAEHKEHEMDMMQESGTSHQGMHQGHYH